MILHESLDLQCIVECYYNIEEENCMVVRRERTTPLLVLLWTIYIVATGSQDYDTSWASEACLEPI